ncbi:thioesterase domain-containing protein [Streptacidiphilus melanogenes]|uniref:thioesterase domain-containing protein n=1 Tax=Streptacidiphilus melanogenes TaxID=411235 RepID=UPI0005A8D0F6|nr:alpha/beta fold hydrolase [Streptacidiphilus melanogenes]
MADLDLDRLVPLHPEGSRVPLFCVHAVSGSAYSYAGLTRLLGDDQPVYGFEAPGFDNDREPVTVLKDLAAEYVDILRAFRPEGEYRLLGWSLGGLLSYEMAKLLTAAGCRVSVLTMVDSGLPSPQPLPPERDILIRYIRDMMGLSDQTPAELLKLFAGWPEDVEAEFVFAAVEESGLLPEEFDAELLAEQYAVFRAHLAGFYSIEIAGVHDGPAVHIIAGESPADEMRWQRVLPQLKEYTVPGTHHSVWNGDSLVALTRIVQDTLDAADRQDGRANVGH